ncbi:hypothetical protein OU678_22725, partial [Escherichia coli]|nr:hypothetical protein [Escherichia coli]
EKQKGSRGIRRGQRYRLVFQFPIRQELIESVSRFDFDVYQQFLERKKEFKEKPVRVPFSKRL